MSRTAWRILVIHISFFSIFKALSNKSNIYVFCVQFTFKLLDMLALNHKEPTSILYTKI